jgi:hypothetical protein
MPLSLKGASKAGSGQWTLFRLCLFSLASLLFAACAVGSNPEALTASPQPHLLSPTATASFPSFPSLTQTFNPSREIIQTPPSPARCPQVTSIPIPEIEDTVANPFLEVKQPVLDFLNAGGSPQQLISALQERGWPQKWLRYVDLTHDGISELVVAATHLNIFSCWDGQYRTLLEVDPRDTLLPHTIVATADMNRDSLPEVVLTTTGCGLGECLTASIYEWDGREFQNRISGSASGFEAGSLVGGMFQGPPEAAVFDADEDGLLDLVLRGGIPANRTDRIYYGPWREEAHLYKWNGENFVFDHIEFSPPEYRFQVVQDGDEAILRRADDKALALYQEAIFSQALKGWSPERSQQLAEQNAAALAPGGTPTPMLLPADPKEYDQLAAYSRYRMMLLYLLQGQPTKAQATYAVLQQDFPPENAGYPYTELAMQFWEAYQVSYDMKQACGKAIEYASTNSEILLPLGSLYHGMQSHFYTPEDICPFK